jgi:glycolate oxidase iron-sulfur subunit
VATGREAFSPRGRNQLLRLMLEGKLEDPSVAEEAFSSCLLCGACTTACYAKVAVPDLVLEGRRALRGEPHWLLRRVSRLLIESPRTLARLLKFGFLLKRLGLSALGRPVLRRIGLAPLAAMDEHVDEAPRRLLDDELPALRAAGEGDAWSYFAPCGPRYLLPRVGVATWRVLTELKGRGRFMDNACCGLLAHNYGELSDARELAKRNIETAEASGHEPIAADCSSCAAFLKSYPQLFLLPSDEAWRPRAEAFAARVRDASELIGQGALSLPADAGTGTACHHDSCRALNGLGLREEPRRALRAVAGDSCVEMPGADACCGGAGAFAFTHEDLSDELLKRKVAGAAAAQARTVTATSTSCLIQLARGFRKYYPEARVLHLSELAAEALDNRHGTQTRA